jgi:hypothetical protein
MIREQFGKLYCLREFNKRGQLFVGMDNKAPSVADMRVNNPDRSPRQIKG